MERYVLTSMTRADAQRSVEAIIAAAREVLAADPGASAESIIAKAGVHRATFYRHFGSREDLANTIYDRFLARVAEIHRESDAIHRPDEALEFIARGVITELQDNRLFLYIAPRGAQDPTTEVLAAWTARLVAAARDQGLLRSDESAAALTSAYNAMVIGIALPPDDGAPAAEKARIVLSVLRGVPGSGAGTASRAPLAGAARGG